MRKSDSPLDSRKKSSSVESKQTQPVLEHGGDDILEALQSIPDERVVLDKTGHRQPSATSIRRLLKEKSALERAKADRQYAEILVAAKPGDPALRALLRDRQVQLQTLEDALQVERNRSKARRALSKKARQRDDELLREFEHFESTAVGLSFNSKVRSFRICLKQTGHQGGNLLVDALKKRLQRALRRKS